MISVPIDLIPNKGIETLENIDYSELILSLLEIVEIEIFLGLPLIVNIEKRVNEEDEFIEVDCEVHFRDEETTIDDNFPKTEYAYEIANYGYDYRFAPSCDTYILEVPFNPEKSDLILKEEILPFENEEPELVKLARWCISNGSVELCTCGIGGTYYIKDEKGKFVGIFKPIDEEPGAINNPKDQNDNPILPPGGGALREVAAYILDHANMVPKTYMLTDIKSDKFFSLHGKELVKSGSIQEYIEHVGDTTCFGSNLFSNDDVHNIGILDIRLINMDRNDENMLVRKEGEKFRLVPIDHTYSLPPKLSDVWFDWMYWNQAKEPFSPETLKAIRKIDIQKDSEKLRKIGIKEECVQTMQIATTFLKLAAKAGYTLHQIAKIVSRDKPHLPSILETILENSEKVSEKFDLCVFEKMVADWIDFDWNAKAMRC